MSRGLPLAAILAGGKARRLGGEKATLLLGGVPLIERVYRRAAAVAATVVVVGGPPRLDALGVATLPDCYPGANSLGGIATALAWAADRCGPRAWVAVLGCDMPCLEPRLLAALWRRRHGVQIVVPRVGAYFEPLCALYRADCLPVFERQIARGELRVKQVFEAVATREVGEAALRAADPDLRSFFNVNAPQDLERAVALLEAETPRPGNRSGCA